MSDATTALAEVLRSHWRHGPEDFEQFFCRCDGWCNDDSETYEDHLAAAVVAAVRGLSPDLQAELIGGEVERGAVNFGSPEAGYEPTGVFATRAVGSWAPEQAQETP